MPLQTKRRRGFKACDPFCSDKVRKALYNRPNGPHIGKLILGKTYLSGLDNKCFSRTGRIKKGYRNIPIDLEREFEIEKRQIKQIQNIIKPRKKKKKKKKNQNNNNNNNNNNNLMFNQNLNKNDNKNDNKIEEKEEKEENKDDNGMIIQSMDDLAKLPNESLDDFIFRVRRTTSHHLNKFRSKNEKIRLKKKQRNLEKKFKKQQNKIKQKRLRKKEDKLRRYETKQFQKKITPQKEYIAFGETNDAPPVDLRKFGDKLFGKKINNNNQNNRNKYNINVNSLSFANTIQGRAKQLELDRAKKNYEIMKQKRYAKMKQNRKKKVKRKTW